MKNSTTNIIFGTPLFKTNIENKKLIKELVSYVKKQKKKDLKAKLKMRKFIIHQKLLGPWIDFIGNTNVNNIKNIDLFPGCFLQVELTGESLKISN